MLRHRDKHRLVIDKKETDKELFHQLPYESQSKFKSSNIVNRHVIFSFIKTIWEMNPQMNHSVSQKSEYIISNHCHLKIIISGINNENLRASIQKM